MLEFAFGGSKTLTNLPQAMRPPQLAEQHGHELAPTRKATSVALGFVLANHQPKFGS
jgi:hypothetical protein